MEPVACHLSGTSDFEVVPRFLENPFTHDVSHSICGK